MKRQFSLLLAFVICLSLCACGDRTKEEPPTVDAIVEGIKYEFKDPDSVQLSDVSIAEVEGGTNEYYALATVRAKNSFGGYANPQAYIIHCDNGKYKIVKEYNDVSFMRQNAFNELGCGPCWSID